MNPRPKWGLISVTNIISVDGITTLIAAPGAGNQIVLCTLEITSDIAIDAVAEINLQDSAPTIVARYVTIGVSPIIHDHQRVFGPGEPVDLDVTGIAVAGKRLFVNAQYWVLNPSDQFQQGYSEGVL